MVLTLTVRMVLFFDGLATNPTRSPSPLASLLSASIGADLLLIFSLSPPSLLFFCFFSLLLLFVLFAFGSDVEPQTKSEARGRERRRQEGIGMSQKLHPGRVLRAEELQRTPTRLDSVPENIERGMILFGCQLIQDAAVLLEL